jgi:hypothetical protein
VSRQERYNYGASKYLLSSYGQLSRYTDGATGLHGRGSLPMRIHKIFLYYTASRPAPGPTQAPIQCVSGAPSPGTERQGREADHSPPSGSGVKNGGITPPPPHTYSWRGT